MEKRAFGPTGERVPVIGQGTWLMEQDDRERCIAALRVGLDAGMTHIDTAEMYGDGYVEEAIVAEAIAGRRQELFLASKVLPGHATFEGTIAACEASLRRLRTGWLDLYLLHWRGAHPLEQTFAAFERLVADGKIRSWGVSNFDAGEVDEAVGVAGPDRLACNQVLYHLQERAIEHAVLPTCERNHLAVVAYAPLGHGRLASPESAGDRALRRIAHTHEVTPQAVALAWVVRRPSVFAIPKAAKPEHARANAAAGELRLTAHELALLDESFPLGAPPPSLPML
jgi:diketogulonate reductase-like aldo/keto reductase